MTDTTPVRCVIYTRTSSDENLRLEYNSLAAQRDACAAYILSQKGEGWSPARKVYDDGGYSGGSLDRPALRQLLADLAAGEFNTIVVYKIDRLTRSLRDFAKISEILDRHTASFVSVTQQFSTASSMGRLTLNILLTFAQFEREVAGDRIRDKIAASARQGIWMGGHPALGYDNDDGRLVVNPHEACIVRQIYLRFIELKSFGKLRQDLEKSGIVSKVVVRDGVETGGNRFTWQPLHSILTNPLYAGMIRHKDQLYPGKHAAIIDTVQFAQVQDLIRKVSAEEKEKREKVQPALLRTILFDMAGERLYPVHTKRRTRTYRYYVTSSLLARVTRRKLKHHKHKMRFSAPALDRFVVNLLVKHLRDRDWISGNVPTTSRKHLILRNADALASEVDRQLKKGTGLLHELVRRIEVDKVSLRISLNRTWLYERLDVRLPRKAPPFAASALDINFDGHMLRTGNEVRVILEDRSAPPEPDHRMVREILRALKWFEELKSGRFATILELSEAESCCPTLITDRLRLAFLAPDIVEAILKGTQPASLTIAVLKRACPLPSSWDEQRRLLLEARIPWKQ